MNASEFLAHYNISEEAYASTGIAWAELKEIKDHYLKTRHELEPTARRIVNIFNKNEKVHSVSYRLKAPEHLMAKIIRRRIGKPGKVINLGNYQQEITDLIGIRVLHLFKEDWLDLHQFITSTWNLKKAPIAYVRRGDAAGYIDSFKHWGCTIEEHPYGYRSVHYLLQSMAPGNLNQAIHISEVQVRTLFEEAWSSIDHHVRYPYQPPNMLINELLVILNRLTGSADEMASCIIYFKENLKIPENALLKTRSGPVQAELAFQPFDEFEWPAETGSTMKGLEGKVPEGSPPPICSLKTGSTPPAGGIKTGPIDLQKGSADESAPDSSDKT